MSTLNTRIEEKLFQNRYLVDAGRPHIKIASMTSSFSGIEIVGHHLPGRTATRRTRRARSRSLPDGCMECGTCRVVTAETGEVEWNYPRGGYGVLFKFG